MKKIRVNDNNTELLNLQINNKENSKTLPTIVVEDLGLSVRALNCLKNNRINTIQDLINTDKNDLMELRNLGMKSLKEIQKVIDEYNIEESNDRVSKSVFFDKGKKYYVEDIKVEEMSFSNRVNNALKQANLKLISEVAKLNAVELSEMKNLGLKSRDELTNKINSIHKVLEQDNTTREGIYRERITRIIVEDYQKTLNYMEQSLIDFNVRIHIEEYFNKVDSDSLIESSLTDSEVISAIYKEGSLDSLLNNHIIDVVKKHEPVDKYSLKQYLPKTVEDEKSYINKLLNGLVINRTIELEKNKYIKFYPSITSFLQTIDSKRLSFILEQRIIGKSLEEIGEKLGVSRERVRQLEKQAKEIPVPRLREDKYKEIFMKYDLSREFVIKTFDKNKLTYGYLKSMYTKGTLSEEDFLDDISIPVDIRRKAETALDYKYIFIQGTRIKKDSNEIIRYLIRKSCKEGKSLDELLEIYNEFLRDNELNQAEEFKTNTSNLNGRITRIKNVITGISKSVRYYDYTEIDYNELTRILGLREYKDSEISTLKLFSENHSIMEDLDIRDQYELHNIMKRVYPVDNDLDLSFSRMPMLEFGEVDRVNQFVDVIREHDSISKDDFFKLYEEKYGIKAETFIWNYSNELERFEVQGGYSLNSKEIPEAKIAILKEQLNKEIYSEEEMKNIFKEILQTEYSDDLITSFNIAKLGFRYRNKNIHSNKYSSLEEYFQTLILKDDIFDSNLLGPIIRESQTYYYTLKSLTDSLQVIEFEPGVFINVRRLKIKDMDESDLNQYIESVLVFIGEETFTIRYLEELGFEHKVYDLGFEDLFYISILKTDNRVKAVSVSNEIILKKSKDTLTVEDLISRTIIEHKSMDIYDFIDIIHEKYGVRLIKDRFIYTIRGGDFYYDSIMEKIYIDYNQYFEEV